MARTIKKDNLYGGVTKERFGTLPSGKSYSVTREKRKNGAVNTTAYASSTGGKVEIERRKSRHKDGTASVSETRKKRGKLPSGKDYTGRTDRYAEQTVGGKTLAKLRPANGNGVFPKHFHTQVTSARAQTTRKGDFSVTGEKLHLTRRTKTGTTPGGRSYAAEHTFSGTRARKKSVMGSERTTVVEGTRTDAKNHPSEVARHVKQGRSKYGRSLRDGSTYKIDKSFTTKAK